MIRPQLQGFAFLWQVIIKIVMAAIRRIVEVVQNFIGNLFSDPKRRQICSHGGPKIMETPVIYPGEFRRSLASPGETAHRRVVF